jgi:hypothetical protein
MSDSVNVDGLQDKFLPSEVDWRVQSGGDKGNGPFAKVLAYIDARAIQNRLDAVAGAGGWKVEQPMPVHGSAPFISYKFDGKWDRYKIGAPSTKDKATEVVTLGILDSALTGFLTGISIKIDGEWVTRWDGADVTDIESFKGGLSSSFKRSAAQWGIGRYLYDLEEGWAIFNHPQVKKSTHKDKIGNSWLEWLPPKLPDWALPEGYDGDQYAHILGGDTSQQEVAPALAQEESSQDLYNKIVAAVADATNKSPMDTAALEKYKGSTHKRFEDGKLNDINYQQLIKLFETVLKRES